MWCKLFGHKWDYYSEKVRVETTFNSSIYVLLNVDYRICPKCFSKQERANFTGDYDIDWRDCKLNVEQSRDKNLKELGI